MRTRISSHIRGNVVGYLALFLVVTGGTAYATHPGGADTISTGDIINGQVQTPDIGAAAVVGSRLAGNSVNSSKVVNNSLTGDDVNEASLVGVNAATTDGASVCRTDGMLTMVDNNGPPVTVCTNGSLSLIASCTNSDLADAELTLDSSAENSFLTSEDTDDPDLDAAEAPARILAVSDGPSAGSTVWPDDTSFGAGNPDGSQLAGGATARATAGPSGPGSGTCEFVVGATT